MRGGLLVIWILVSLLALGLVTGLVVGVRQAGGAVELETALAATAGDAAWLASLPRMDPKLRDRAWSWMKTDWPTGFRGSSSKDYAWFLAGEPIPHTLLEHHEGERDHMEVLSRLLDRPGLCLSSAAWALDEQEQHFFGPRHIPHLVSTRYALRWYGMETMLEEDPLPALPCVH